MLWHVVRRSKIKIIIPLLEVVSVFSVWYLARFESAVPAKNGSGFFVFAFDLTCLCGDFARKEIVDAMYFGSSSLCRRALRERRVVSRSNVSLARDKFSAVLRVSRSSAADISKWPRERWGDGDRARRETVRDTFRHVSPFPYLGRALTSLIVVLDLIINFQWYVQYFLFGLQSSSFQTRSI